MKSGISLLSWIFSVVEFIAQVIVSPFVILTVLVLLVMTKLIGRKLRQSAWKMDANWNMPTGSGARLGA